MVLPLLKPFSEQVRVIDDFPFEEPVEVLRIDPAGPLHLHVQAGCSGVDLGLADAFAKQMPVERLPEFLPAIGLDLLDLEWQLRKHVIDELDRGPLVVTWVRTQDPDAGAVIDRGVLVVALLSSGLPERFDERHIDRQGMARALLLVTLPSCLSALVALGGGESVQSDLLQESPDSRGADREIVIAGQVHCDLVRPEVGLLT